MTAWENFSFLKEVLVVYYFGNPLMFYLSIVLLFVILLTMAGLDFRASIVFSLPLIAAFSINGYFGEYSWIINLALLVVAVIYGYALMKLMT